MCRLFDIWPSFGRVLLKTFFPEEYITLDNALFQGSFAIFNTLFRTSFSFLPASNGIGLELFSGIWNYSMC